MPSTKSVSGAHTSGVSLWNAHEHKKSILDGLKIDNQSIYDEKIEVIDCFATDAAKTAAAGATQAAEDFRTVTSGKVRFQMTVPTGEFQSLGPDDLKEETFLGTVYVRGSTNSPDCVVVASYRLL